MALPPHSRATTPLAAVPRAGLEIRVRCPAGAPERQNVRLEGQQSENRNSKIEAEIEHDF